MNFESLVKSITEIFSEELINPLKMIMFLLYLDIAIITNGLLY